MPARRDSSRSRFRDYLSRRKADPRWAKRQAGPRGDGPDKSKRSRSFLDLFRAFWSLTTEHHRWVYFSLATLTVTTALALVLPASTKVAIDYIVTDNPGPTGLPQSVRELLPSLDRTVLLWWLGGAMVAVSLLAVAIGIAGRWQMTRATKRVQIDLRTNAFTHATTLPLHRVQFYKTGGMASLLREDAGLAGELLFTMIYNPWRAIVQLTGTLVILGLTDWRLLLGGLLLIPVVWITHRTWINRIRPLYRDAKYARTTIDAATTETFAGLRVVRGFARERSEASRFVVGQHFMTRIEILTWWWSRIVEIAWGILIPAASAALLIYGGRAVIDRSLTLGDLMMFSAYLLMLLGPLEMLTSSAANIQSNLAALDRVLNLLQENREFAGATGGIEVSKHRARGEIVFDDVSFAYPKVRSDARRVGQADPGNTDGDRAAPDSSAAPVLTNVSFRAAPGHVVALVGPSGAGKTTLCNLIARFYDPTSGTISLDGLDLRRLELSSFRSLLGIVEQDVFLFDGSVAENIAYGLRDAPEDRIVAAARAANAHDFITQMEKGYDTVIGERGVRLSGGQKQRIAIARALLADPRILILDEATSNLDTESERLIQESLARLMRGRTCFVIAHRLSTIRNADQILVLEHGRLIESGTHEELLDRAGRYAFFVQLQTEGHQHKPANTPAGNGQAPLDPALQTT